MAPENQLSLMQIRDTLVATVPAQPTDSTIDELQDRILTEIGEAGSSPVAGVILDVTSVQTVDSFFARTISETAKMVELMGSHPVLVGISPEIAITATELGFGLDDVDTVQSMDAALDVLGDNSHERHDK